MRKIKHIESGVVIDLEELEKMYKQTNDESFLKIKIGHNQNRQDVSIISRIEFDFGLRLLSEFKCLDQPFDEFEISMLITMMRQNQYNFISHEEFKKIEKKLIELL